MTDHSPSDPAFDPTDPLVAAWTGQDETSEASPLKLDPGPLADSMAKAHRREQWRLALVNVREVGAGLVVAGVYASLAGEAERPAAVWVAAVAFLAVVGFLAASSVSHHWADRGWDTSIRNQIARRLAQLHHRSALYRNVAWWYFLPLLLANALFVSGMTGEFGAVELLWSGGALAISAVMYRYVRRTSGVRYDTEIERLESLLAEFDGDVARS